MRIDIETGETQILGIVSMGAAKKGCTTVIPAVFARVSKYVGFIKRNLKNFVDPHIDIHKHPTLVCLIAEHAHLLLFLMNYVRFYYTLYVVLVFAFYN